MHKCILKLLNFIVKFINSFKKQKHILKLLNFTMKFIQLLEIFTQENLDIILKKITLALNDCLNSGSNKRLLTIMKQGGLAEFQKIGKVMQEVGKLLCYCQSWR